MSSSSSSSSAEAERVLLPAGVVPAAYRVALAPDIAGRAFSGTVAIDVEPKEERVSKVTLHAWHLEISAAAFVFADDRRLEAEAISLDDKMQTVTLDFGDAADLGVGKGEGGRLELSFSGILNSDMDGFYHSVYKSADGKEEREMAVTQFEPTGARRAFPCWDEPAHKATFEVSMTIPDTHTVLSNMTVADDTPVDGGKKTVRFHPTVKMSTYIVAFAVFADFEYVEGVTKKGVPTRVWSPPGKREHCRFALDVSLKVLDFFSEYFDIDYPLPKVDHIALADFSAGAMENWGLITYRETALLIDENASVAQKQRVANVVSHELAHMWFGNLVTMEWWNNLWLNEAFATYIASMAVNEFFPEWEEWISFVAGSVASGMGLDQLDSSHPVQVEVKSAGEVMQIFDAISYHKGSALLRHIWGELGPTHFRDGLRVYLKRHKFSNTVTADLFAAWTEVSGLDVSKVLDPFVETTGFPLLTVGPSPSGTPGEFALSQKRFFSSGLRDDNTQMWPIPLRPAVGASGFDEGAAGNPIFLESAEQVTTIVGANSDWVKFNRNQTGFYRTRYEAAVWQTILPPLCSQQIPAIDRVGLVSDCAALCFACLQPASQLIELAKSLVAGKETEPEVVTTILASCLRALSKWNTQKTTGQLREVVRSVSSQFLETLGEEDPAAKDTIKQLRASLLSALRTTGDEATVDHLRTQFQRWRDEPASVSSDVRPVAFEAEVARGGVEGFENVLAIWEKESVHAVKLQALRALGVSPDMALIRRLFSYALGSGVKAQDFFYALVNIGSTSAEHASVLWQLIKDHWEAIDEKLGTSGLIRYTVSYGLAGLTTAAQADDAEKFFQDKNTERYGSQLTQSLEKIRSTARWVEFNQTSLEAFLDSA